MRISDWSSDVCSSDLLYRESADSIRFAMAHQWKSLGATLVVFAGMVTLARLTPANATLTNLIIAISFLSSSAVIYMLVLYQAWQNTEREKLRDISSHYSNFSQHTRSYKALREATRHSNYMLG